MSHPRPFRFGLQLSRADDAAQWTELARKAEDLGFATLFLPDHFGDQLAPIPALTAAAAVTTDLRLGTLVFDNDYRHPVVLAKEAATVDLLSEGRLELGIGAGWMASDYEQSGMPYDAPKVRVDRMEEGVAVLKGLFADGPFSYQGEHYTITELDGQPKPVQRPHPPILIGAAQKRLLSIAGREADIVGINPAIRSGRVDADAARSGLAEETDQKLGWVREAAGDRYDDLELNMLMFSVAVTDDRTDLIEKLAPLFGLEPPQLEDYPHALIGSTGEICDQLRRGRERWDVSYVTVQGDTVDDVAPVVAELAGT